MGKMKKEHSLKRDFGIYMVICAIAAFVGTIGIGHVSNLLQSVVISQTGYDPYEMTGAVAVLFWIVSYAQVLLMPMWCLGCVAVTGNIFYNKELKEPISVLMNASEKISRNELDFTVDYTSDNELGQLCSSFEEMRSALDKSSREMWRTLDERKRLNSAFSHDLRTPLTVLKGYANMLEKYIPEGRMTEEKIVSVIGKMNGQVGRLESYTQKMNELHKLEDIEPDYEDVQSSELVEELAESGLLICGEKQFSLSSELTVDTLFIDRALFLQVYENLVSNAVRYAESKIDAKISDVNGSICLSVSDDGCGFTDEALRMAKEPFYRDDKEQNSTHFGLGLYICRVICEKCGGTLEIANSEKGGIVTAKSSSKKS